MSDCENIIRETGLKCGADPNGPFHTRFCSNECADRMNKRELEELGITTEMMKLALEGYYECRDMIDRRERDGTRVDVPASESRCDGTSGQPEPNP